MGEEKAGANRDSNLVTTNLFGLFLSKTSVPQAVVCLPWVDNRCILCKVCSYTSTWPGCKTELATTVFFLCIIGKANKLIQISEKEAVDSTKDMITRSNVKHVSREEPKLPFECFSKMTEIHKVGTPQ